MGCFKWKENPVISCPLLLGILCLKGLSPRPPNTHSDLSTSSISSKEPTDTSIFMSNGDFAKAFIRLKRKFVLHTWLFKNFLLVSFSKDLPLSCSGCFLTLPPQGTSLPGRSHSLPGEFEFLTLRLLCRILFYPVKPWSRSSWGSETLRDLRKQISKNRQVSLMRK